jgi:hypothetical protein
MLNSRIDKPRTTVLNLGGPGTLAGVCYSYNLLTSCIFLSSGGGPRGML